MLVTNDRFNNVNLNHEKSLHHIYNIVISIDSYAFLLENLSLQK
jgi:hypothetical protein